MAALATPVYLAPSLERTIETARRVRLDRLLRFVPKLAGSDIGDKQGRDENPTLNATPVRSSYELLALLKELREEVSKVKQPLFLAHGAKDRTVPYENLDYLAQNVSSEEIEVLRFPRSQHVLTLDVDRAQVAESVARFFARRLS